MIGNAERLEAQSSQKRGISTAGDLHVLHDGGIARYSSPQNCSQERIMLSLGIQHAYSGSSVQAMREHPTDEHQLGTEASNNPNNKRGEISGMADEDSNKATPDERGREQNNNGGSWTTQGKRKNLGSKIIQNAHARFINIPRRRLKYSTDILNYGKGESGGMSRSVRLSGANRNYQPSVKGGRGGTVAVNHGHYNPLNWG